MFSHRVCGTLRRVSITIGLVSAFGGAIGCVALVPYSANTERFKDQKPEDIKKTFAELVTRSLEPRYTSAEINEDFLKCDSQHTYLGPFYTTQVVPGVSQVYFNNVSKIEIYENNKVWIYDTAGRVAFPTTFASRDDCLLLVDIIETFRARKAAGAGNK